MKRCYEVDSSLQTNLLVQSDANQNLYVWNWQAFHKVSVQLANRQMKMYCSSLVVREMHRKSTLQDGQN